MAEALASPIGYVSARPALNACPAVPRLMVGPINLEQQEDALSCPNP
jgi:hypothetical protein